MFRLEEVVEKPLKISHFFLPAASLWIPCMWFKIQKPGAPLNCVQHLGASCADYWPTVLDHILQYLLSSYSQNISISHNFYEFQKKLIKIYRKTVDRIFIFVQSFSRHLSDYQRGTLMNSALRLCEVFIVIWAHFWGKSASGQEISKRQILYEKRFTLK